MTRERSAHGWAAKPGPVGAEQGGRRNRARHVVISIFDHPRYNGGGQAVVKMIAGRLAAHFEVTVVTTGAAAGRWSVTGCATGSCRSAGRALAAGSCCSMRCCRSRPGGSPRPVDRELYPAVFYQLPSAFLARSGGGFRPEPQRRGDVGPYRLPFFLVERFGLRFYRDVVVLNQADCARSADTARQPRCRSSRMGSIAEALTERVGSGEHILFLGRIDIRKGLDLLLAAYKRSGLAMPLLVAGSGTRREERSEAHASGYRWRCPLGGPRHRPAQAGPAGTQRLHGNAVAL